MTTAAQPWVNSMGDKVWTLANAGDNRGCDEVKFAIRVRGGVEEYSVVHSYFPSSRGEFVQGNPLAGIFTVEDMRRAWAHYRSRGFSPKSAD